jgi:hypothetical protein
MLAYVFWHRPHPEVDRAGYEGAMLRFQATLTRRPSPGLIDAWSHRIDAVPWLGDQPGYEDWCLLQGSWAMDPLNGFAVAGDVQAPHDALAAQMAYGAGGLYALELGEACSAVESRAFWMIRPRGIQYRPVLAAACAGISNATAWRRQMVLGPAPEFCVEVPASATFQPPQGWQAREVKRARLMPQG